ncbi:hypothetical protein [Tateyamaria pelophila]|uniref:hypothetical protein n=1 Tax=Tateyamaria pelophila TaxID=328415 RepID=UPI001CBF8BBC|nr:hypothetical protein [Tateyamaria pelophila]
MTDGKSTPASALTGARELYSSGVWRIQVFVGRLAARYSFALPCMSDSAMQMIRRYREEARALFFPVFHVTNFSRGVFADFTGHG